MTNPFNAPIHSNDDQQVTEDTIFTIVFAYTDRALEITSKSVNSKSPFYEGVFWNPKEESFKAIVCSTPKRHYLANSEFPQELEEVLEHLHYAEV